MSVATHSRGPNPARNHSFHTYDSTLNFLIERPGLQAASLTLVEHISRRLICTTSSTRLDDIVQQRSLYTTEDGGRPSSRAHRHNSVRAMVCLSCQFCSSTVSLLGQHGQPSGRITQPTYSTQTAGGTGRPRLTHPHHVQHLRRSLQ
jgi:hypothetical protein